MFLTRDGRASPLTVGKVTEGASQRENVRKNMRAPPNFHFLSKRVVGPPLQGDCEGLSMTTTARSEFAAGKRWADSAPAEKAQLLEKQQNSPDSSRKVTSQET